MDIERTSTYDKRVSVTYADLTPAGFVDAVGSTLASAVDGSATVTVKHWSGENSTGYSVWVRLDSPSLKEADDISLRGFMFALQLLGVAAGPAGEPGAQSFEWEAHFDSEQADVVEGAFKNG